MAGRAVNNNLIVKPRELPTFADACKFLASMVDVAPVKEIKDQAGGIEEYAIAAKNPALLEQAIRIRYEVVADNWSHYPRDAKSR